MRLLRLTTFAILLLGSQVSSADPIYFEAHNVSGDTWEYTYTVGNDTADPIDWFTIWFDPELYFLAFDTLVSGPAGWDLFVAETEFLFPGSADNQPGFLDACGFFDDFLPCGGNAAVLPGELLGGFSIQFDWLGGVGTTPGSQPFTLYGSGLGEGQDLFTQALPMASVPEPGTLALLGVGLAAMGMTRRRRERREAGGTA